MHTQSRSSVTCAARFWKRTAHAHHSTTNTTRTAPRQRCYCCLLPPSSFRAETSSRTVPETLYGRRGGEAGQMHVSREAQNPRGARRGWRTDVISRPFGLPDCNVKKGLWDTCKALRVRGLWPQTHRSHASPAPAHLSLGVPTRMRLLSTDGRRWRRSRGEGGKQT